MTDQPHIMTFESLEVMQDYMTASHDAVMEQMDNRHRALMAKRKFYWVRPLPDLGCWVFGSYDLDAWIDTERKLSHDPAELAYIIKHAEHNNMERGYKSGTAYSILCPEGELGDTHVSVMLEISTMAFAEAAAVLWRLPGHLHRCPTLEAEVRAFIDSDDEET